MASESYGSLSDEGFVILSQIFCAFAQGADGVMIDGSAILAARHDYAEPVERSREHWPVEGPLVLMLTKGMGRLAAHYALERGSITIGEDEYKKARIKMRTVQPFCPFHHRFPHL